MMPKVRALGLSRWHGRVRALANLDFELGPGIWGLLGPNGSGKTTLMRLIAGLIAPSLGRIEVCGEAPFANPRVLGRIGFCPEPDAVFPEMSAFEFVSTMAELNGFSREEASSRSRAILEQLELGSVMDRPARNYSRGMRQRVKLAQALVHDPEVILLDEPMAGVDPLSRHAMMREIHRRGAEGATILLSSHVLSEIEALTNQILLLVKGHLLALGDAQAIREMLQGYVHRVRVECDRPRELALRLLENFHEIEKIEFLDPSLVEFSSKNADLLYESILREAILGEFEIHSIVSPDDRLDALFQELIKRNVRHS
ncbi:MAG: ABC transporter ATP-binding protein [Sandaracinaceae bacterium]|nr:ABC transporter ATP-binding protein [Sandaracinaceae bacterium]